MTTQNQETFGKTHDLGHGWYANQYCDDQGVETMTLRNPDKGQRIDLPNESVKTLRSIFKAHQ